MIGSNRLENASQEGLLEVHSIDVGQGDATLIIGPDGETTLVDVGVGTDAKDAISENIERRFQARDDVDGLDNIVVTHFDQDHADRAAEMANDYDVDSVYTPSPDAYDPSDRLSKTSQVENESLSRLDISDTHATSVYSVDTNGVQRAVGKTNDQTEEGFDLFSHEDADASVLNPAPKDRPGGVDRNSGSLAFSIDYGSKRAVLTSDASELARGERVTDEEIDFSSGYEHGSKSSIGSLQQVGSRHVNFSCDESEHGHPHDEMTDKIAERGSTATTTQEHGTTSWITDGETDEVFTQHGEPVDGSECSGKEVSEGLSSSSDPEPGFAPEIPAEESPEPQYRHDQDMPGPEVAGELPSEPEDLSDDSIEETFEGLSPSDTEELSEFFSDLSEAELEENADIDVDEAFEDLSESDLKDGFTVDADEGISVLENKDTLTDIDGIGTVGASALRDAGIDERSEVTAEELANKVDGIGDNLAPRVANELPLEGDTSESEAAGADDDREQSVQRKSGEGEDGYGGEGTERDGSISEPASTDAAPSGTDSGTEAQEPAAGSRANASDSDLSTGPRGGVSANTAGGTEQGDVTDEGESATDETEATADDSLSAQPEAEESATEPEVEPDDSTKINSESEEAEDSEGEAVDGADPEETGDQAPDAPTDETYRDEEAGDDDPAERADDEIERDTEDIGAENRDGTESDRVGTDDEGTEVDDEMQADEDEGELLNVGGDAGQGSDADAGDEFNPDADAGRGSDADAGDASDTEADETNETSISEDEYEWLQDDEMEL